MAKGSKVAPAKSPKAKTPKSSKGSDKGPNRDDRLTSMFNNVRKAQENRVRKNKGKKRKRKGKNALVRLGEKLFGARKEIKINR